MYWRGYWVRYVKAARTPGQWVTGQRAMENDSCISGLVVGIGENTVMTSVMILLSLIGVYFIFIKLTFFFL